MKQIKLKNYIFPLIAALIILTAAISLLLVPGMTHKKIINVLNEAGFETSHMKKPDVAFGAMLYKDVSFDQYDFSTAKYIKVTFNPLTFLLTGKFRDLDVIGLNLTGDWADETNASLSFSGWALPDNLANIPFLAFRHISIRDSRVTFMTESAGGISVFIDTEANRKNGKTEFQSSIKTEQKFMSLVGSASGIIDGSRWYSDFAIDDGKAEDPSGAIKVSRMNGWFNVSNQAGENIKIMGEFRAGGLSLFNLPWQNASATLDYTDGDLKLFTEAKSVGYDGLELEVSLFKNNGAAAAVSGSIHSDQLAAFSDYLKNREEYAGLLKDLKRNKSASNIDIDFLLENSALHYEIKNEDQSPGKTGDIPFKF